MVYELRFEDGQIERFEKEASLSKEQLAALDAGRAKLIYVKPDGKEIVLFDLAEIQREVQA